MANTETKTPAKGEKMVKVKFDITRHEKDDIYVALNGKPYLIKRGEEVEVPIGVAEILKHKEEMLAQAIKFEEQAAANADF